MICYTIYNYICILYWHKSLKYIYIYIQMLSIRSIVPVILLVFALLSHHMVEGAHLRTGNSIQGMSPFEYHRTQELEQKAAAAVKKVVGKFNPKFKNLRPVTPI